MDSRLPDASIAAAGATEPSAVAQPRNPVPQPTAPCDVPAKPLDEMTDAEAQAFWRRRISWREVAAQLALGHTVNEVARAMQIEPYRIRRNLTRSARFRRWIYEEQSALMEVARRRMARLQLGLPEALAKAVAAGNPRLLAWFAEELKEGDLGLETGQWGIEAPRGADGKPRGESNFDLGLSFVGRGIAHARRRWRDLDDLDLANLDRTKLDPGRT